MRFLRNRSSGKQGVAFALAAAARVLDTTGAATPLALRDNLNVPANGIVRITWIPDDRPGNRMCLCHILGHTPTE